MFYPLLVLQERALRDPAARKAIEKAEGVLECRV